MAKQPVVRQSEFDSGLWILVEPYERYLASLDLTIRIEPGFETDSASVPRIFWLRMSPVSLLSAAPMIHDFLYRRKKIQNFSVTREEADIVFRDLMREDKVPEYHVNSAYWAVRLFGWSRW